MASAYWIVIFILHGFCIVLGNKLNTCSSAISIDVSFMVLILLLVDLVALKGVSLWTGIIRVTWHNLPTRQ